MVVGTGEGAEWGEEFGAEYVHAPFLPAGREVDAEFLFF